ncbi:ribonuclease HI family protein [Patescibacteria group bacterium]|nr:ribonuclease HI family protein [Patescibacteria group bacterium]
MKFFVHTDGGARGNPGPGAVGVAVKNKEGKIIKEVGKFIGRSTNNEAEYKAVIEGLKACDSLEATELEFYIDSLLVASQLSGKFKIKEPRMRTLFNEAKELERLYKKVTYTHVPREKNYLADRIVNEVLDTL